MIQPRGCCSLTANARESGIRPPSRGTHALPGQASTGNALGRYPRPRIRPPSWWERNRGQRPRAPSRGTHPTAIAPSSAEKERPRTLSQAAPSGANMAGRSARPSGVVPPNQRMQPDAVPATEIGAILAHRFGTHTIAIYHGGAADAQRVSPQAMTACANREETRVSLQLPCLSSIRSTIPCIINMLWSVKR